MERIAGYYWVKNAANEWLVAKWDGFNWWVHEDGDQDLGPLDDDSFNSILGERIPEPKN